MPALPRFTIAEGPELADEAPIKQRVLSGNFRLTLTATDQRSASMAALDLTGPIYSDDTAAEVDERIDFYQARIRRQQVIAQIAQMEALNVSEVASLESLAEHIAGLAEQTKAGRKLATTQKMQVENYDQEVTKRKQLIVQRQAEIAALKKKAGV